MAGSRVQWTEHRNERILFCDYSNIENEEEYIQAIVETEAEVLKQAPGTLILMLIDTTGSRITSKITERSRALSAAARKRGIPSSPTVIVGVSNAAQKAIVTAMQFLRPDLHTAESIELAKNWLVNRVSK